MSVDTFHIGNPESQPSSRSIPDVPGRVGRVVSVAVLAAVVGWLYVNVFADNSQEISGTITAAARQFSTSRLDIACSDDGMLVERGKPCAESGGFRFVLGPNGRYDLFAVEEAGYPQRVADSDHLSDWKGTDDQFERLTKFATVTNGSGE